MDIQTYLNNAVAASRAETLKQSAQLMLGELILHLNGCDPDKPIVFDFGPNVGRINSWRGSYSELALAYGGDENTVGSVLQNLESSLGKTFEGYKGGDFVMGRATPIWVANWGDSGVDVSYKESAEQYPSIGVVGVDGSDDKVVLLTAITVY